MEILIWKDPQEIGKKRTSPALECDGNGKRNGWEKKKERGSNRRNNYSLNQ